MAPRIAMLCGTSATASSEPGTSGGLLWRDAIGGLRECPWPARKPGARVVRNSARECRSRTRGRLSQADPADLANRSGRAWCIGSPPAGANSPASYKIMVRLRTLGAHLEVGVRTTRTLDVRAPVVHKASKRPLRLGCGPAAGRVGILQRCAMMETRENMRS